MSLLDYLRRKPKPSAAVARERLQIILAHENGGRLEPDYLPALKKEILDVVRKYVSVDQSCIKMNIEKDGTCDILELNISLSDAEKKKKKSRFG